MMSHLSPTSAGRSLQAHHLAPSSPLMTMAVPTSAMKLTRPSNTLVMTIPGFKKPVRLPFPEKALPVCLRCKKNYKTRELCRVRDGHTGLPWTLTYVCVTLDESCIDPKTGRIIDSPLESRGFDYHQPYCEKDEVPKGTPICASCKEKNYTRAYCREKQKHKQLPWSTVYVTLYKADGASPSSPTLCSPCSPPMGANNTQSVCISPGGSVGTAPSTPDHAKSARPLADGKDSSPSTKRVKTEHNPTSEKVPSPKAVPDLRPLAIASSDKDTEAARVDDNDSGHSEPLYPVPQSRTFLIEVTGKETTLRWLAVDSKNAGEPLRPTLFKTRIDERAGLSPSSHSPHQQWGGTPVIHNSPGHVGAYGQPPPHGGQYHIAGHSGPYAPPPFPGLPSRQTYPKSPGYAPTVPPPPHWAGHPPASEPSTRGPPIYYRQSDHVPSLRAPPQAPQGYGNEQLTHHLGTRYQTVYHDDRFMPQEVSPGVSISSPTIASPDAANSSGSPDHPDKSAVAQDDAMSQFAETFLPPLSLNSPPTSQKQMYDSLNDAPLGSWNAAAPSWERAVQLVTVVPSADTWGEPFDHRLQNNLAEGPIDTFGGRPRD